jgi:hypothetical protein
MTPLVLLSSLLATAQAGTISSITTDTCTAGSGPGYIVPLVWEDGQFLGHRFGPFGATQTITSLTFNMAGSSHGNTVCDSLLTPNVYIWTLTSSAWPNSIPTFTIATTATQVGVAPFSSANDYTVYTSLASNLTVPASSYVFVAIEEQNAAGSATCYVTCKDGKTSTSSMYSDSDVAPMGWDALSSYGISYDRARIILNTK